MESIDVARVITNVLWSIAGFVAGFVFVWGWRQ